MHRKEGTSLRRKEGVTFPGFYNWVRAYEEKVAATLQQKQETELDREVRRLQEQLERQRALSKERPQERSR